MYWRHLWEVHVAHSVLSINLSILGMTARATSLSPWCYCQENNMSHMKSFWVHCLLRFSALTDRDQVLATLLHGCQGWRNSNGAGWRSGEPHLWMFPEQHQANQSWKQVFLQWGKGKRQFRFLFSLWRPDKGLKGWCGGGGGGECFLLLVSRFEEVRFQKEIRDLGCEGQYKKRKEITISPVVQALYAKWKDIMMPAKRTEHCKGEVKPKISYWRNVRNQS